MEGMHHEVDAGTGQFPRDPSGLPMAEPTKDEAGSNGKTRWKTPTG
jgi:hypothetical protein